MKKSLFVKIITMLLAVLLLASCTDGASGEEGKLDMSGPKVDIVKNGESEYVIVRKKNGPDYETDYVVDLQNRIEKITGATLKIVSDNKEEKAKEILIGSARDVNANLGEREYMISNNGGRFIITAGGEDALKTAYEIFLKEILGCSWHDTEFEPKSSISVPENLNFKDKILTREDLLKITQLIEYPEYPEEAVRRDYDYSVKVTQGDKSIEIPVYNQVVASNYFTTTYNGDQHRRFSEFAFGGDPVTIEVTVNMDFNKVEVQPSSKGIDFKVEGNKIIYTLDKPQTTMVKVNEDIDSLLAIFAEEPELESEIPNKDLPNVIYFEAGYHKPEGGVLKLESSQQVYLAPGAVVAARVQIKDAGNVSITGRGAFVEPSPNRMPVSDVNYMMHLANSNNIMIDGIKLLDAHTFNIYCESIADSTINGVKVLSNQISTDGLTMQGTDKNVKVTNSFWHIGDDIFVYSANLTDVSVENCIVGSGYGVFTPTVYKTGGDTHFKNVDVFRCGRLIKVINRIPNPSAVTYMENIFCEDVSSLTNLIDYQSEPGGSTRSFYLKNVTIKNQSTTDNLINLEKGFMGMDLTVENVWVDGKELNGKNDLKVGTVHYGNKLTYVGTFDKEAAKVDCKNVVKVNKTVAESIYIANLRVATPIPSFEMDGTRYVAVKEILKNLDFTGITEADGVLTFKYKNEEYKVTSGKTEVVAKGNKVKLSKAPTEKNGVMCVPLEFFEKVLGTEATYDSAKKRVNIKNIARTGNLLRNGGLEDGMNTDWVTRWFTPMYLSTEAHSGNYSMKMRVTPDAYSPGSANGIYQDVADIIRRYGKGSYKVTAWVKKGSADCNSKSVSMGMTQGYDPGSFRKNIALTDQWQKIEFTYNYKEPPQNLSTMYFFVGYADGTIKDILIDDMSLEKIA